jgi:hypothetical protein
MHLSVSGAIRLIALGMIFRTIRLVTMPQWRILGSSRRRARVAKGGTDRVTGNCSKVLSTILDSGALRIRDVTDVLRIPRVSMNALMQYLKRKHLVKKTGPEFDAPGTPSFCLFRGRPCT